MFLADFDVAIAASAWQRDQVARLRHRVYCEEFAHELPAPDRRERDRYDGHSVSILITHRPTGLPAGTVRLICASEEYSLALEDHCLTSLHLGYAESLTDNRDSICEFSRLAVDPGFRSRASASRMLVDEFAALARPDLDHHTFSTIGIAAFLAAFAAAEVLGRHRVYAMMSPSLPRLLHRAGIPVRRAGDFMDYHGSRAPFFTTAGEAVSHIRGDLYPLFEALRVSVGEGLLLRPTAASVA
jgi:N-acyl amino acid synthase of PEP-CTERM/exosortase system